MMYSPYCQESMVPVLADGIYTISSVGILHCESVILAEGGGKISGRFRNFGILRFGRCCNKILKANCTIRGCYSPFVYFKI